MVNEKLVNYYPRSRSFKVKTEEMDRPTETKHERTIPRPDSSPVKKRKFVINSVTKRDKAKVEPILATFTNAKPVKDGNLKGNLHQKNRDCSYNQHNRVFTVETPWLHYYGKNFEVEDSPPVKDKEAIFIGILNKNTGKMRLVQTSSYILQPKLAHIENEEIETLHEKTFQEKQEENISQFGSKRARQFIKQRKLNEINIEGMVEAIHKASSEVKITEEDFKISVEEEDSYLALLPECNRQAKSAEEVYKLEYIAPDDLLVYFEETARQHVAKEITFDETYSELMKVIVSIAKFEIDEENQVRYTCLALYVEQLVRFLRLSKFEKKNKEMVLEDCPEAVKNHIVKEYTSGKLSLVSTVDKDRILCLILVLALIGCKFEIFTGQLIDSLQIDLKKLHILMRVIGATYIRENLSFRLQLPLTTIAKSYKRVSRSIKGRK